MGYRTELFLLVQYFIFFCSFVLDTQQHIRPLNARKLRSLNELGNGRKGPEDGGDLNATIT